jgi:hypothetical protein
MALDHKGRTTPEADAVRTVVARIRRLGLRNNIHCVGPTLRWLGGSSNIFFGCEL